MISINKDELKLLLEKRKKDIEIPKLSGIGEIASGVSLILTLSTSQFNDIPIIGTLYFKIFCYLFSLLFIGLGLYLFIRGFHSRRTVLNLYEEILELEVNRVHIVNIIVVKNSPQKGKFLLVKNSLWKCNLFPSYNVSTKDEPYDFNKQAEKVKQKFSKDIGIADSDLKVTYIGESDIHTKICAGKKIEFRYLFHFFHISADKFDSKGNKKFTYDGKQYVWMSLDKMMKNKNIMKKNYDVVDYIANMESYPYN